MKTSKTSSYLRLVAFLLIALLLVLSIGFVANGWQGDTPETPDNGNTDENSGDTDENTDGTEEELPPPIYIPEHVEALTGLESSAEATATRPLAFVMDSAAPLYGLSTSLFTVEFPVENGQTRLLSFSKDLRSLGKIGSFAPQRSVIAKLASALGGTLIAYGSDDRNGSGEGPQGLDLLLNTGYSYTENTQNHYSNADLLSAALKNCAISLEPKKEVTLPFVFPAFGEEAICYRDNAATLSLPYSIQSSTGYVYSSDIGQYLYTKGGSTKIDLLTAKTISYTNVIVLFADTVTYENETGTHMVLGTEGGGRGFAFTGGTVCPIQWSSTAQGGLILKTEDEQVLCVNRGTTSISFFKSSQADMVTYR